MQKLVSVFLAAVLAVTVVEVKELKRAQPISAVEVAGLYEASVFVRTTEGSGSGTIFRDRHGELLILTAAHVVGLENQALCIQTTITAGARISGVAVDADVIALDVERDLALLRPHTPEAFSLWVARNGNHVAKIYRGKTIPSVTTMVVHIGSRLGIVGERSVSFGIVSGIARSMESDGAVLDQTTAPASPGSSGGGIFDAHTGELIGVLVRGYTDTFSFYVPARDINVFLKNSKH